MKLKRITYGGFRNLEQLTVTPHEGVNIIYGENAQGKTNILEGIWLFSGLKSFRGAKDRELVAFSKNRAKLASVFETSQRENRAEIVIDGRRRASLNGVELNGASGLIGKFGAVVFSPSFMSVVKEGPSERRRFIDAAICQLKPSYAVMLTQYKRLLVQRAAVLKDTQKNPSLYQMLEIIDEKAAFEGERITEERVKYIQRLSPFVTDIYSGLSGGREEIGISYTAKNRSDGETLLDALARLRSEDIMTGATSAGPHRDDIDIKINGVSARTFGSQGQQRSCALAMKLAEASVISSVRNEQPVMLLDDVMSELDESRQDYILNHIKNGQVFITCCDPASVLRLCEGRTFRIKNGGVTDVS